MIACKVAAWGEVLVGVMGLLIGFEVLSASVVLAVEFRRGGMV